MSILAAAAVVGSSAGNRYTFEFSATHNGGYFDKEMVVPTPEYKVSTAIQLISPDDPVVQCL